MDFRIWEACDCDFDGILQCILNVRGPDYYRGEMYNAGYLKSVEGIKFFAAADNNGKVIGIVCAIRHIYDDNFGFMGMLSVCSDCSNNGIGTALVKNVMNYLTQKNAHSIKANVVTAHDYMQHSCEKLGLIPTGFLFDVRKPLEPQSNDKKSLIAYVVKNKKAKAGTLYIDQSVAKTAKVLYNKLDVEYDIKNTVSKLPPYKSNIIILTDEFHFLYNIIIYECGQDFTKRINALKKTAQSDNRITLTVYLNINSPTATEGYNLLKNTGFIFTGFDPLGENNEFILMHYRATDTVYSGKAVLSEKARELFNMIFNEVTGNE